MIRALGLIGLVLALLVVGILVKKQLGGTRGPAAIAVPAPAGATGAAPATDLRTQSLQIQQQFKQSLDAASQPRPMPDDN